MADLFARRRLLIATVLLTTAWCCGAQSSAHASPEDVAVQTLHALAESPEAQSAEAALLQELRSPAPRRALRSFLAHNGNRLSAFQASYLRLGLAVLSPVSVRLVSELESGHVRSGGRRHLFALLATIGKNPAVKALMRKGSRLKKQPKRLHALARRLGEVASSVQPPTFESEMAAVLAGPGGQAVLSRLDPLDLALLLPPDEVMNLHFARRSIAKVSTESPSLLEQGGGQQGDGLSTRQVLKVLWKWPRTGITILKERGERWWAAHREQAKKYLGKALVKWLLSELGLGWVLPVKAFIDKHAPELQKKFDPTQQFPPEMKPPPSAAGEQCQAASTIADGETSGRQVRRLAPTEGADDGARPVSRSAGCVGEEGGPPGEGGGSGSLHWTGSITYQAAIADALGEFEDVTANWFWNYSGTAEATWSVDAYTPLNGVDPYEEELLGGSDDKFFQLSYSGSWHFFLEEDYYFCNGYVSDRHLEREGQGAGAAAPSEGKYFEEVGIFIDPHFSGYELWLASAPLGEERIAGTACAPLPEHRTEIRWDNVGDPPYYGMPSLTPKECHVLEGGVVHGLHAAGPGRFNGTVNGYCGSLSWDLTATCPGGESPTSDLACPGGAQSAGLTGARPNRRRP